MAQVDNMEKITFGDNLPGYIVGPVGAPGLVVIQVRREVLR